MVVGDRLGIVTRHHRTATRNRYRRTVRDRTVKSAVGRLLRSPYECLVARWNWKSALFSSLWRAGIFFATNAAYGWRAAVGAMVAEFVFRAATAGFYGVITQEIAGARPRWLGNLVTIIAMPMLAHNLEAAVHFLRQTPNLRGSILVSVCFTVLSTMFNLHAMRRV